MCVSNEIQNYCMGIKHQLTVSYCTSQNGVSERKKNVPW